MQTKNSHNFATARRSSQALSSRLQGRQADSTVGQRVTRNGSDWVQSDTSAEGERGVRLHLSNGYWSASSTVLSGAGDDLTAPRVDNLSISVSSAYGGCAKQGCREPRRRDFSAMLTLTTPVACVRRDDFTKAKGTRRCYFSLECHSAVQWYI